MATTNLKVRTGNKTVVLMDGNNVGLVQSVRASDDYSPEPASGIGDIHIQEYVPSTARHTLAISQLSLYIGSLRTLGLAVENGDAVLQGGVFDIVTMDKSGTVLRKYTGCSYASGDVEISAHKIIVTNAQFNALDVTGLAT